MTDSRCDPEPKTRTWNLVWGVAFLALALCLQVNAISKQSFSGDGVYHLIAGNQALRYGANTINLEHPPLAKLVFALPALFDDEVLSKPLTSDQALAAIDEVHRQPELLFRSARRARWMALIVFVLPLWVGVFFLGRRSAGLTGGLALASMFALSFTTVGISAILQTDAALALGFVLTTLACIRLRAQPRFGSAILLGLALGFSLAVKHSAVLLVPAVVMVVLGSFWKGQTWRRCLTLLTLVALVSLAVLETVYGLANLEADSHAAITTVEAFCEGRGTLIVGDGMRSFQPALVALAGVDLRLAQWLTGIIGISVQDSMGVYASYALGEVSTTGRWWYFPALLLVKLPLMILGLAVIAFVVWLRSPFRWRPELCFDPVVVTVLAYLAAAMWSNYNLGVRHFLPVLPLMMLPLVRLVVRRRWTWVVVAIVLVVESWLLAPSWMSATNAWWLGQHNPSRFAFGAGNTEYRQNFFRLADELEQRGVHHVKVLYPTLSEEVLAAYLPEAHLMSAAEPVLPGWYVVNVIVEQYLPALVDAPGRGLGDEARRWQPLWQAVKQGEDQGYVADTFHLYSVPEP